MSIYEAIIRSNTNGCEISAVDKSMKVSIRERLFDRTYHGHIELEHNTVVYEFDGDGYNSHFLGLDKPANYLGIRFEFTNRLYGPSGLFSQLGEMLPYIPPRSFFFISTHEYGQFRHGVASIKQIEKMPAEKCVYEVLTMPKGLRFYLDIDGISDISVVQDLIEEVKNAFMHAFGETVKLVILRSFPDKKTEQGNMASFHIIVHSAKTFNGTADIGTFARKYLLLQPKKGDIGASFSIADPLVYNEHQKFRVPGSWKTSNDQRTFIPVDESLKTIIEVPLEDCLIQTFNYEGYDIQEDENILTLSDEKFKELEAIVKNKVPSRDLQHITQRLVKLMKCVENSRRMRNLFSYFMSNYVDEYSNFINTNTAGNNFFRHSNLLSPTDLWNRYHVTPVTFDAFALLKTRLYNAFSLAYDQECLGFHVVFSPKLEKEPLIIHIAGIGCLAAVKIGGMIHITGYLNPKYRFEDNQFNKKLPYFGFGVAFQPDFKFNLILEEKYIGVEDN